MSTHGVGESTIQTSRLVLIVGISLLALGFILGYGTATLAPAPEARSDEARVIEFFVNADWCQARGILTAVYHNIVT